MSRWPKVLALVVLAGCARFEPRPLSPGESATSLEKRSLNDPGLRTFLETNLHRQFSAAGPKEWDFQMLTLTALYYQPSLQVARARWAVARGGEVTAAQRPNPSLNVTPGYDTTTSIPSPWIPLGYLDVPIETAGKRRYRREEAAHGAEAARFALAATAWDVRSGLRASLLDYLGAERRQGLLANQISLQQRMLKLLDQQQQAGAITGTQVAPYRIAWQRTRLDLAEAQRLQVEARARVAESLGVSLPALDEAHFSVPWLDEPPQDPKDLQSLRRAALQSRPDILQALAEYAAAQSALQLQIARQYPDLKLSPGYQYDQGDNKWSLGLTVELPVLSQNQGPIAEAKARRQEAAARFLSLQAKVMADVDRAAAVFASSATNLAVLRSLGQEQARRRDSIEAQFQAGALDQLELLNVQLESATAELLQLDGQLKAQQAFGAIEDALKRPLSDDEAVTIPALEAPASDPQHRTKPQ